MSSLGGSTSATGRAYELADLLRLARMQAMASSTYVRVGIAELADREFDEGVAVAVIAANNGQESDFTTGDYRSLARGSLFDQITLDQFPTSDFVDSGRQTSGVDDISEATVGIGSSPVSLTIRGNPISFTRFIQFDPMGSARIKTAKSRWIEIGIKPTRAGRETNHAILQISGLTGQTRIFRP